MATNGRFKAERHTALKLVVAGIGLAGFTGAWVGFANSHAGREPEEPAAATLTGRPTVLPAASPPASVVAGSGRTAGAASPSAASSAATTPRTVATPAPTQPVRTSRGS